ncbi:hypothetical protein SOVF_092760 isoform A [Spinacia oleracea]|nr:hypothetical protein SOVF_092760 isoform A [Spinacia oleracea]
MIKKTIQENPEMERKLQAILDAFSDEYKELSHVIYELWYLFSAVPFSTTVNSGW